jgi:hypothetical protein
MHLEAKPLRWLAEPNRNEGIDAFSLIFVTHGQGKCSWTGVGDGGAGAEYLNLGGDIRISLLNGMHFDGEAVVLRVGSMIALWMGAMCLLVWVRSRT